MKRKYIEIFIIICLVFGTSILYLIKSDSIKLFSNNRNNEEISLQKKENTIKVRDDIRGVKQPSPFITDDKGVDRNLFEYGSNNLVGQLIYLQKDNLPKSQQVLLANNKDATQYILGYLFREETSFEYGETAELKRKYPYYLQWDKRWAYDRLGENSSIAIGGCGPTSIAMALGGILNDETITPRKIAEIENANGYFTPAGTSWNFFEFIAKEYGVKAQGVKLNKNAIDKVLEKGNPIITSVHPGKFTTVGHIILISEKDSEGNYIINDPNSYTRTLKKWTYDELKTEIVAMWEFLK
ncbi:C39 family peptidase [Gemella cuniculi]|uniref:C39 family peptidase n=1 Tax=Gemella cuniculi TaxID=150240 RepID=UPI0003FBA526|nr:C39 family peptidase [Gemella cuniculi]